MTNLATKNGSLIVKDGKLAENCGCCGGWYCYDARGCCVVSDCVTSFACEEECAAAGGVYLSAGSPCDIASFMPPLTLTVALAGSFPSIDMQPPCIVVTQPFGQNLSNTNVMYGLDWAGSFTVSRSNTGATTPTSPLSYIRQGAVPDGSPFVTVVLKCDVDLVNKKVVYKCESIWARAFSPTLFRKEPRDNLWQQYGASSLVSTVTGDATSGFTVPANNASLIQKIPVGAELEPYYCGAPPPSVWHGVRIVSLTA